MRITVAKLVKAGACREGARVGLRLLGIDPKLGIELTPELMRRVPHHWVWVPQMCDPETVDTLLFYLSEIGHGLHCIIADSPPQHVLRHMSEEIPQMTDEQLQMLIDIINDQEDT